MKTKEMVYWDVTDNTGVSIPYAYEDDAKEKAKFWDDYLPFLAPHKVTRRVEIIEEGEK